MENVHHSFPESNVTSSNASAQAGGCCDRTPLVHTERRLTTVNPWRCREKVMTAADDRQDGHLQYLKHDVSSATCGIKHHKASNIFYFFFQFCSVDWVSSSWGCCCILNHMDHTVYPAARRKFDTPVLNMNMCVHVRDYIRAHIQGSPYWKFIPTLVVNYFVLFNQKSQIQRYPVWNDMKLCNCSH